MTRKEQLVLTGYWRKLGRTVLKLSFGNPIGLLYFYRRTQLRMPSLNANNVPLYATRLTQLAKSTMRIYLTDQSKKFPQHIEFLKKQPVMKYDRSELTEKTTVIPIDTAKGLQELNTDFFFDYKIFPSKIMTYLTQWNFEKREMQIGDTIVQQAFIPPFRHISQKIVFGVRINDIINEPTRIGFSYETLNGHVEKGISIFTIEQTDERKTIFKIHTFSQPGNLLTKLVGSIISVPYQTYCTQQGLINVRQQLESS